MLSWWARMSLEEYLYSSTIRSFPPGTTVQYRVHSKLYIHEYIIYTVERTAELYTALVCVPVPLQKDQISILTLTLTSPLLVLTGTSVLSL